MGGKLWAGRGEARTEVGTVSRLLWQTLVRLRAQQGGRRRHPFWAQSSLVCPELSQEPLDDEGPQEEEEQRGPGELERPGPGTGLLLREGPS